MNDLEIMAMDSNGNIISDPEAQIKMVIAALCQQSEQRKYEEALLWRYELGFWLLALALVIDLARWLWG